VPAALGAPPGGEGWRVALDDEPGAPRAVLSDGALSVSAQHGRRNARGEGHVLGARLQRAAVQAPDATSADAWSTALLVLGRLPDAARAYVEFVERELDVAVSLVGTGAERASVLSRA